jgi:hypothetical protein
MNAIEQRQTSEDRIRECYEHGELIEVKTVKGFTMVGHVTDWLQSEHKVTIRTLSGAKVTLEY